MLKNILETCYQRLLFEEHIHWLDITASLTAVQPVGNTVQQLLLCYECLCEAVLSAPYAQTICHISSYVQ